ncbi:DUF3160 domain-containing protein [soil metagenome]
MRIFAPLSLALLAAACGGARSSTTPIHAPSVTITSAEQATLARQSVVLAASPAESFHIGYDAVFRNHKRVYVTADALLYAFHHSYDAILRELETNALIAKLHDMLSGLRSGLVAAPGDSLAHADVDAYLAIALSLLEGTPASPVAGASAGEIAAVVALATAATGDGALTLAGEQMHLDYSMLMPRGHYTQSEELKRYFRAMAFVGRAELRIATRDLDGTWKVSRRAFAATELLRALFSASPASKEAWHALDATLAGLVGPADSMGEGGYEQAIAKLDPKSATDAQITAALVPASTQRVKTQLAPPERTDLAYVVLGQRYVADAQTFGDVTYGSLKTKRMMPTPLDIGQVVFRNPAAAELLANEKKTYGSEYENALLASAARIDAERGDLMNLAKGGSLYHGWLFALRELSPDHDRDATLPAPFNSNVWAKRMLNTQLASWAELRHDNLLYAKQSVTAEAGCDYPDGYVDPYPAFWTGYAALGTKGIAITEGLPLAPAAKEKLRTYFARVQSTGQRLAQIADRERKNEPLTDEDGEFFNHMVSVTGRNAVCTTVLDPGGWYADLFYDTRNALAFEPVIADVHTQPTDENGNRVGKVLHVATAPPRMMAVTIAHDGGAHTQTYYGFVSTYAELTTGDYKRYTDDEWRMTLGTNKGAVVPSWEDELQPPK